MIWWILYLLINLLAIFAVARFVPVEHRKRYDAAAKGSTGYRVAQLCSFAIPTAALAQVLIQGPGGWPLPCRVSGLLLMVAGAALTTWAWRVNPEFTPDIARPRRLVAVGPYRPWPHHPGYFGMALAAAGKLLLLGQDWAIIPVGIYLGFLIRRSWVESKLLYG